MRLAQTAAEPLMASRSAGMQRASRANAAIATVALGATGVVVAMAARWPLSGSARVDAQSAQTPTDAVLVLLAGAGMLMFAALVVVLSSGRQAKDEREPPPINTPWWMKLLAILLPLALGSALVAAAVLGSRPARTRPQVGLSGFGTRGLGTTPVGKARPSAFVVPAWLPWTLLGIVAVALMVGLAVALRRRAPSSETTPDARATRAAVQAAIGALETDGDARRAVIAAYGSMQRTLSEHGIARSPDEAPREYLQRVLTANQATEQEATTLTQCFEEARYSAHAISEHLRSLALSALRSLRSRLSTSEGQA
jgi:hypothetical protein